jgi:hypothetical protein
MNRLTRRLPAVSMSETIRFRIGALAIAGVVTLLGALPLRGEKKTNPSPAAPVRAAAVDQDSVLESFGRLPLSFEANRGQTDERVKFLSRGPGYTVFLTNDEAVVALAKSAKNLSASAKTGLSMAPFRTLGLTPEPSRTKAVVRMRLVGANAAAQVAGISTLPGTSNYLRGKDSSAWQTNVTNYSKVAYKEVYPGIDLVYYGNQIRLEYDFVISPGSDPNAIQVSFGKSAALHLDRGTGDLLVGRASDGIRFQKPVAYQLVSDDRASQRREIESRFVLQSDNRVTFEVGAYDHGKSLVIDPTLGYSTYLGGNGNDLATAIAIDSTGSAYVTGYTTSTNYPVSPGAYQSTCGGGTCSATNIDAFVTKMNSTGTAILYSTYLGGSGKDYGYGIAVDASGDAFIGGTTFSADFPVTTGALQTKCGGNSCSAGDGFVTELNTTGSGLVYSTYLGGSNTNQLNAIALDIAGNAYVTGYTKATNFPVTPGVFQPRCSSCTATFVDGYVAKLNSSGSALVYASYLGGNNADVPYAIALDASENAYITGYTYSTNFPTTAGAFQNTSNGPTAAFVSKVNPTATALAYSTYLGGNATGTDACPACATTIAVDAGGNAYVAGLTWETNFPTTTGAYQVNYGGGFHDAFVTKLNPTGTGVVYSTYIGGSGDDGATSLVVDSAGTAYIKGNTFSTNFPTTPGALKSTLSGTNSSDAFVVILNPAGSALNYSTYLGGSGSEYGSATAMITIDSLTPPNIYLTGYGNSPDFPVTTGAYQTKLGGTNDGFVVKFVPSANVGLSPALNFGNQNDGTTSAPQTITVTNTGNSTLTVSSVVLSGTNVGDFAQTNTCTAAGIAPQATCAISVTFSPKISGAENATVTITDNAPNSPQTSTLTGVGLGSGPAVTLSPTSLVFPTQLVGTKSAAQSITLTNTGTATLSITTIAHTGDFSDTTTCGTTVVAGASCTITVTFTPTTVNARTGTISVTDNAPASPQTVALSGTGTYVSWTPTSLIFANQAVGTTSAAQTITFTNHAPTTLTIKTITTTGVNNSDFAETNTCGTSVARMASCTITVTFTPKATGARTANVTITDFLGGNTTQNIPLTGTGQ